MKEQRFWRVQHAKGEPGQQACFYVGGEIVRRGPVEPTPEAVKAGLRALGCRPHEEDDDVWFDP